MKSSSCCLDPFPATHLKSHMSILSPIITQTINLSLQTAHVPPALKTAVIRLLLKKPSLDPDNLANNRPISNLPFLTKVLATQLLDHLTHNSLFEKFQSGFRSAHSTKTVLLRVTNYLMMSSDSRSPSLIILLDLTAAFDSVDHTILLKRLHNNVGLTDHALKWFESYLSDRSHWCPPGINPCPCPLHYLHASPWSCHQQTSAFLPLLR